MQMLDARSPASPRPARRIWRGAGSSRFAAIAILLPPALILFSLFVQMSEGATFSVVPFVNCRALGAVSGIVGAGGNVGAVMAGFLFKSQAITWPTALLLLGAMVTCLSFASFAVVFSPDEEAAAREAVAEAIGADRRRFGEVAAA